jgi:hypothetical protein
MKTELLTPELAHKLDQEARNPDVQKLQASSDLSFFNPKTGAPIVWYTKSEQGTYELFNHEGFHPQLGTKLQPVTPDVAQDILRSIQSGATYKLGDGLVDLKKHLDAYAAAAPKQR